MGETGYLISEAAKQAGVESHVLRYWEEELKLPIARNEMGHRYYTKQDIQIFLTIKELKKRGFQLKMIRELVPRIEDVQMEQAKAESDVKVEAKELIAHDKASDNEVGETVVNDKFSKNEVKDIAVKSEAAESETVKGGAARGVAAEDRAVKGEAAKGKAVKGEAAKDRVVKGEAGKSGTLKGEAVKIDAVKNVTAGQETAKGIQKSENRKAEEKVKNQASQEATKKMDKLKLKQVKSVPVRDIKKDQEEKTRKVNQQEAFYQIMERLFIQLTGEKRSEDRYKRLDAAIRKHQYSRRMVAATEEQGKKRKKK